MNKKIYWIIRFAVATIALIIIYAVIQPMIDAEIARQSIELATKQMEIEGSQEYTVYHNIMQVCYWGARVAEIGAWAYMGFCSYNFICNKGENEK
jgi:hypothetical protein